MFPASPRALGYGRPIILLFLCVRALFSAAIAQCDSQRWPVKTGTDDDASRVQLAAPSTPTTIAALVGLRRPDRLATSGRNRPTETTVWVVSATLAGFMLESDLDYHLVLQDDKGHTLLAEIPSPECVGSGSPFASRIASVRAKFEAKYRATPILQSVHVPVRVTGVGFFDTEHDKPPRGASPNEVELHPVLGLVFE
jgi:hypothetical protein